MRQENRWQSGWTFAMAVVCMIAMIGLGCAMVLVNASRLGVASFGLEGDQADDLRELQQLLAFGFDAIEDNGDMYFRQREQTGACRINGIAEWRIRLVSGAHYIPGGG